MFEELTLINFQSWKKQIFKFSPGVNVIIGESDTGKSAAFIRAIRLLATNQPSGDEFISHWVKKNESMAIDLLLDNGLIVFREKGKNKNLYGIAHKDGRYEDQEFFAFGKGKVPERVAKVLNLEDYNIQGQLDGPFMLNMTPGEVARELNKACKLEAIDRGLGNSAKRVRGLERQVSKIEQDISSMEDNIEEMNWIEDAESKLTDLEKKEQYQKQLIKRNYDLFELMMEIQKTHNDFKAHSVILKASSKVDSLLKEQSKLRELIKKMETIDDICQTAKYQKKIIEKSGALLSASKKLEKTIKLNDEKEILITRKNLLNFTISNIKNVKQMYEEAHEEMIRLEEEFHELMPDICPLCGK